MADDFIPLNDAVIRSGLHPNTLRRLLREGVIRGFKAAHNGKSHWLVSVRSLDQYTDPIQGFLLELRGPKLFLIRRDKREDD